MIKSNFEFYKDIIESRFMKYQKRDAYYYCHGILTVLTKNNMVTDKEWAILDNYIWNQYKDELIKG